MRSIENSGPANANGVQSFQPKVAGGATLGGRVSGLFHPNGVVTSLARGHNSVGV
jgi:hypothetical protein